MSIYCHVDVDGQGENNGIAISVAKFNNAGVSLRPAFFSLLPFITFSYTHVLASCFVPDVFAGRYTQLAIALPNP